MKKLLILTAAILLAASIQAATFDITSDHSTGGLGTPPFGTVTLNQNGTTVDVTVALATGYKFALTGAGDFMDFKFNATGVVLGDITFNSGTSWAAHTQTYFHGDGTGNFLFGIDSTGQGNGGSGAISGPLVFHVANATIADLTVPNNLGIIFVADLLSPNGNTGPADVSGPSVPDGGSTLALLGAALVGLGGWRRILRK